MIALSTNFHKTGILDQLAFLVFWQNYINWLISEQKQLWIYHFIVFVMWVRLTATQVLLKLQFNKSHCKGDQISEEPQYRWSDEQVHIPPLSSRLFGRHSSAKKTAIISTLKQVSLGVQKVQKVLSWQRAIILNLCALSRYLQKNTFMKDQVNRPFLSRSLWHIEISTTRENVRNVETIRLILLNIADRNTNSAFKFIKEYLCQ